MACKTDKKESPRRAKPGGAEKEKRKPVRMHEPIRTKGTLTSWSPR